MDLLIKQLMEFKPKIFNENNHKTFTIIGFSLFFGWLLSVPFEGQVLYMLMENLEIDGLGHNILAIIPHFLGLFISGFFIKKQISAKVTMVVSTIICICGSLIFYLPFSVLWNISIIFISFFSGLFVASWGYYFKIYSQSGQRFKIASDVLICTNLIMIFIDIIAIIVSPLLALSISIIFLLGSLLLTLRLEGEYQEVFFNKIEKKPLVGSLANNLTPMVILCIFILIFTINSGLMYQVVNPAFSYFKFFTSFYWAIPYIVVLVIIRNLPSEINLSYILYVALAMLGISYIAFMIMDRSILSYIIINTLMMGSFGVFDLFWWSILSVFFDYYDNPAQIWGGGLSMNVLGILIGGYIGGSIINNGDSFHTSIIALIIVLIVVIMLPILNNQILSILKKHVFLMNYYNTLEDNKQNTEILDFKDKDRLTEREIQIVNLLLKGYTYKAMSKKLFVTENTIKFHVKNIYQKYNVKNKMELIRILIDKYQS